MVRILERLSTERGYPAFIRSDNGPEFIAAALVEWAEHHGVILDMYLFRSLSEVRTLTEDWRTNARIAHWVICHPLSMQDKNWMEILTGGGTKNRRDYIHTGKISIHSSAIRPISARLSTPRMPLSH